MPIRIGNGEGVPILENHPLDDENLEANLGFPGQTLGVRYIPQMASNLCWAASAQMVFDFYGHHNVTQCQLVDLKLGPGSHCCDLLPPAHSIDVFDFHCDVGCLKEDVEKIYKTLEGAELNAKPPTGPLTFEQLDDEINKNHRPVEVGIQWTGGNRQGGHVVIVHGCVTTANNEQLVFVNDPLSAYGQGQVRFVDLLEKYHTDGKWVSTWTEISKPQ
jgi:hypothetical protein